MPKSAPLLLGKWFGEEVAAAKLNKTPRTLQSWRRLKKGPRYSYNGKEPLYTDEWLEEYLRANVVKPKSK